MNLKLILPHPKMEAQFNEYIAEWKKSGEEMVPSSADPGGSDYATWLEEARAIQDIETCPPHLVPADTYFLIDENEKIVGAINIRRELNDYLYKFGGNIGYGIRPSERKKGYATIMLKLGLEKCQELVTKTISPRPKPSLPMAVFWKTRCQRVMGLRRDIGLICSINL